MALIIWTSAEARALKEVVGPIVSQYEIEHRIESNTYKFPPVMAGDIVLACGSKAMEVLRGLGLVPKNKTVTSLRGKVIQHNGASIFLTFDPMITYRDYARFSEIQWDVQLAIRLARTGSTEPVIGKYRWVESLHELILRIEQKYEETGKPVDVACDLETKGLNAYDPAAWIIMASFTVDEGFSDALYFEKHEAPVASLLPWEPEEGYTYWEGLWNQIQWVLTSPKVSIRGANFKYDSNWLVQKWGIYCTNHKFDTMLVGSLLDENRSNSLKLHAKILTPMGGYEDDIEQYDMGCMELIPRHKILNYGGGDTDVTYRVANTLKKELLVDRQMTNFYVKLLHPSSKVFEQLERNGMLVDVDHYHNLQTEVEAEVDRIQANMLAMLPNKLKIKHMDSLAKAEEEGKNPFKPSLLREFLFTPSGLNLKPKMFTPKSGDASIALEHLLLFADNPDAKKFIDVFSELGSAQKTLSTHIIGFLKHLRPDNRFHASYMLHRGDYGSDDADSGTNTGRTSAKDPAVQCLPRWINVLTEQGQQTILSIVEGYERGNRYKVPTHDGSLRDVIGVYRNGVRPVLRITFESGRVLDCTENHPLLTSLGFVRADNLRLGDLCYGSNREEVREVGSLGEDHRDRSAECPVPVSVRLREYHRCPSVESVHGGNEVMRVPESGVQQNTWAHHPHHPEQDVHLLEEHKEEVQRPQSRILQELRGCRGSGLCSLARVQEFLAGHGGDASGMFHRARGSVKRVRARELQVDSPKPAKQEQAEHCAHDVQRENTGVGRLVRRDWASSARPYVEAKERMEPGSGPHHAKEAEAAGYSQDAIKCIDYLGDFETFDLTIEGSHSFVANGMVVHNTIPKHTKWTKKLRAAYIAPPGKIILNADFSQGELRIAAVLAEEPTMLAAYGNNMDLHAITAAQLNNLSMEAFLLLPDEMRDELRSGGKAGNFGLLYGMGANGYREYARNSYGVDLAPAEAVLQRDAFFKLYKRLPEWHKEYKGHAHNWGFVRSPLGRVRHLPLINSKDSDMVAQAERQSVNAPVQSCLSDMMQLAMVYIDRVYGNDKVQMFLMTHDSISMYIPEDEAHIWPQRIKTLMETLPLKSDFGWDSPLKFVADVELGKNLAELKKVKGLV
jgi:DNA polymerase I-like protein with 3'-5' exonuclease and polymerase domains